MKEYGIRRTGGKRLLSLLMVVTLLLGVCPLGAFAATELTLSYDSGAAQDFATRYLIYFDGITDTSDMYWNNNTIYIDGEEVSGDGVNYVPIGNQLALCLQYDVIEKGVKTAENMTKPHILQIKSGTPLGNNGEFTIAKDIWLKLDGYEIAQYDCVELSYDSGVAQDGMTRYMLLFDGITDFSDRYWNNNTVYIDGEAVSGDGVNYVPIGNQLALCLQYDVIEKGVKTAENMTKPHILQIKAGTPLGNNGDFVISEDICLKLDGYEIAQYDGVELSYVSGATQDFAERFVLTFSGYSDTADICWNNNTVYIDGAAVSGEGVHYLPDSGNNISLYLYYNVLEKNVAAAEDLGVHTLKIPAGTILGDSYMICNDLNFRIDGDTITPIAEPAGNRFWLDESNPGGWQGNLNRYIIWLKDDISGKKTALDTVQLVIDGETKNVETALVDGRYLLILNATCGITAMGEHSVQITAGQKLGEYTVAKDVLVYTHTDGSITSQGNVPVPEEKFITLSLQIPESGGWQEGLSRYIVWLTDDLAETPANPGKVPVMIDGEEKTAETAVVDGKLLLILNAGCGIAKPGNHTVVISKDSFFGEYKVTEDVVIYTHTDGAVSDQPPLQIPDPSESVKVEDDIRNHQDSSTDCIWFRVSPEDQLPYDLEADTCVYGSQEDNGIYFNGELITGVVIKKLPDLYFLNLTSVSPIRRGDVVTLDGVFGNGDYSVRFERQSFVYLGNGNWEIGEYLRDLREQQITVQDISELKKGVSEFSLKPGNQVRIGEAISSTNIAIRTKLVLTADITEVKFGFSKIGGMWDASEAGWQVSLLPATDEIKMFHGMSDLQTMGGCPLDAGEYVVEIGSVDMDEYVDGVNQGVYCRKIYVKINGEEMLSYQDTNFDRNLGKELFVYTSADGQGSKLLSLTSTGVTLREVAPKVYDYYDISGFAASTVGNDEVACLGEISTTGNFAVRLRLNPTGRASELKLALGKVSPDRFWDIEESGWQLWMRPASGQVFLAHSMDTWEVVTAYQYANTYTVEFGVKDQIIEKDGKYVSTDCRILYVSINGEEIARWEDQDFGRTVGNNVLLYSAIDTEVEVSTLRDTVTLPVEITVNGEKVENTEFVKVSSKVVEGKTSSVHVTTESNPFNRVILDGVYLNSEKLTHTAELEGKYTYTLEAPKDGDTLKVALTAKALTTDEPETVFDLFDLCGQATVRVPQAQIVYLGTMVNEDGQAAANSAVRYGIVIPNGFNHIPLTILGDKSSLWGYYGAMLEITPGQIHFCHTATSSRLASFASPLFNSGSTVCVEFGVVKCYEEGVYKYDRWYVKAGKTESTMELVGWYDSVERGVYGANVACYGVDVGGEYQMYSLKNTYSITDVSTQENKNLLRTYYQLDKQLPELYFTGRAEAYANASVADSPVQIVFFTQPGTSLKCLTVAGKNVTEDVTVNEVGAYSYIVPSLNEDIEFSYEIEKDDTMHAVSVQADETLQIRVIENSVVTGGDVTIYATANVGFVPSLTVNGADITERLILDEETGVWSVTLKSIRADTQIVGVSQVRDYQIILQQPENGTVTLGGDVVNGKLAFGGRLELILTPDDGCYIQTVTVGGKAIPVDSEGKAVLKAVYMDAESLDIQVVFVRSEAVKARNAGNWIMWCGIGGGIVIVVAVLLLKPRKKRKEG